MAAGSLMHPGAVIARKPRLLDASCLHAITPFRRDGKRHMRGPKRVGVFEFGRSASGALSSNDE